MAVATRNFGAPIRRNEDARLLSGQALFLDDVELFLRSVVAIRSAAHCAFGKRVGSDEKLLPGAAPPHSRRSSSGSLAMLAALRPSSSSK
jgi:hypothetical protein